MTPRPGRPILLQLASTIARELADQDWRTRAACRTAPDPDVFYPLDRADDIAARKCCRGCPVRSECLAYALAVDDRWGIWGGLSTPQRLRLGGAA